MIHYILQTIAFQLFFLIVYDLFLKKETFFNWNRFYLLMTAVASVLLPFIKLESVRTMVPEQLVIRLPEVIIGDLEQVTSISAAAIPTELNASSFVWSWNYLLYAGMLVAAVIFLYKIIKISRLIRKNPKHWNGDLIIVNLIKSNAAFSFFHFIFLGEWIEDGEKEIILNHEIVHVKQKHSADLLLFELLRILFWFNPLIYMYQNRITTLHEYIADASAVKQKSKTQYYENLLSQVFDTKQISFTNTFYKQSLIKKRILMLSKSRSNRIHLVKYALLIPLIFGMLMYTSSHAQNDQMKQNSTVLENTDAQLQEKYYKELQNLEANKTLHKDAIQDFLPDENTYIISREDFYKLQMTFKFLKDSGENYVGSEEELNTKINRTYEDYLIYKASDEAKQIWENGFNGTLRLFVNNISNLTEAEEKRKEEKTAKINKNEYYNTLVMTDGSTSSIIVSSKEKSKNPTHDNFESLDSEVPFAVIDEVPTFKECESLTSNEERKVCTSKIISEFVNKNYNTKLAKEFDLKGKQRIIVVFKIDKNGDIIDVKARAPHPALEAEAIRVIAALPEMIPGKHRGKVVRVPYSLPILFMIQDDEKVEDATINKMNDESQSQSKASHSHQKLQEYPFAIVDQIPTFPEFEDLTSKEERKAMTSLKISEFVNANFNTKLGDELKLSGTQNIVVVFKIGKDGKITNTKARSKYPELEKEAIRVVGLLPQMIPGKHEGEVVIVSYALPIQFKMSE